MTNFNSNEKFCGKSLKSLSADEMSLIYGASDGASDGAEPRWTPTPIILKSAAASSKVCISAAVSGIGGLVSYNNDCLG